MCTSPLHLVRPQFGFNLDVPCNDCLECRSASQDSWIFRLGHDLKDLYAHHGFAVFLTFTYNENSLPHTSFGFNDSVVPCFSADHVSSFLNKVKVYMSRTYGKGAYRYFWCSEYGKFTKRPHYHVLFMLNRNVDYYQFCETCRKYWKYGFMFPKNQNGIYVDNEGKRTTPLLHHVQNACSYVCKYITKDLDYCNIPLVKRYLDVRKDLPQEVRSHFNRCLPRHWQSKGIGSSYLSSLSSPAALMVAVDNGVSNPTNLRNMQLPRYYIEKLCFTHPRMVVRGVPVVLRELKEDYALVVRKVHENSFRSKISALHDFIINSNLNKFKNYGYTFSDLKLVKSYSGHVEELFCKHFVNNLSPKAKYLFFLNGYKFCIPDILSLRMQLYNLVLDDLDDNYFFDDHVAHVIECFNNIVLPHRADVNKLAYERYLMNKKLRLLQKHLICNE